MGRNDKNFGTDLDRSAQLVGLISLKVPTSSANADGRRALAQEPPRTNEGDPGHDATEEDEVAALDKIARDMALLATLVMRRRQAKSENTGAQDEEPPFDAPDGDGSSGFAFAPIGIALQDESELQFVDSIEQAVECLTTKWPIRYGDAYEAALQACIDGVKGRVSPDQVRSAFVNAADAAGIRVIP